MNTKDKEQELLTRILQKDEKAFFKFYSTYQKQIFNFAYKQLYDYNEADELTQDVFIEFIEALRNFRGDCSIKTFLFSIAKHKAIDTIRKRRIKRILFAVVPDYVIENVRTILLDDEIDKEELKQKIQKAFSMLPNNYSFVLRLKYIDGDRVKEIARKLSLSFRATESLIYRARKAFEVVFNKL